MKACNKYLEALNAIGYFSSEYTGTNTILQVVGPFGQDFEMNKENKKWMIEYIATENYDRKNLVIK